MGAIYRIIEKDDEELFYVQTYEPPQKFWWWTTLERWNTVCSDSGHERFFETLEEAKQWIVTEQKKGKITVHWQSNLNEAVEDALLDTNE